MGNEDVAMMSLSYEKPSLKMAGTETTLSEWLVCYSIYSSLHMI